MSDVEELVAQTDELAFVADCKINPVRLVGRAKTGQEGDLQFNGNGGMMNEHVSKSNRQPVFF